MPPAFVLSQDQTLKLNLGIPVRSEKQTKKPKQQEPSSHLRVTVVYKQTRHPKAPSRSHTDKIHKPKNVLKRPKRIKTAARVSLLFHQSQSAKLRGDPKLRLAPRRGRIIRSCGHPVKAFFCLYVTGDEWPQHIDIKPKNRGLIRPLSTPHVSRWKKKSPPMRNLASKRRPGLETIS